MAKRVVITGLAPISPIGLERVSFWQSLIKGVSGIKKIERFAESPLGYHTKIGGEISNFTFSPFLEEKRGRRFSRFTQMSIVAAYLAVEDAHLKITPENSTDIGIILGTGIGGLDTVSNQVEALLSGSLHKLNPLAANAAIPNAAAMEISIELKIKGLNYTLSTGCSSSGNAIGNALDMIRNGRAKVILAGGAETPLTDVVFATFDVSKQMTTKNEKPAEAVTPFALNRDGFALSEGSAIVVLEEYEHALKRGAHIYAELVGFSSSADAYDSYKLQPEGFGLAQGMGQALKDSGLTPYDIDYVCAHGSGSQGGDRKETNALKNLFGPLAKQIPVSTIKAVMGMPFGASAAFQVIASCQMLEKQTIIPTLNLKNPDPECDLDYVPNQPREAVLKHILINSLGLGGNNAVLVLKKYE